MTIAHILRFLRPERRCACGRDRARYAPHRVPGPSSAHAVRIVVAVLATMAASGAARADKYVFFGEQADGTVIYVQAGFAAVRKDGRLQGWFRTVPRQPATVTDDSGVQRAYTEMLALNVAECSTRRMGAASLTYRDAAGAVVATFRTAPEPIEFREVKPGTLAESMFAWLCAPKPRSAAPPSAAAQSPFR